MRRALVVGLLLFTAGCETDDPTESSVTRSPNSIVIQAETLVPCSGSGRFCCVRTQFVNTNARTVEVSLEWRAFNFQGQQFATAIDYISGVGPGATVVSISSFFGLHVESCGQIARFERSDLDVYAF
jgi:hypothetical protein